MLKQLFSFIYIYILIILKSFFHSPFFSSSFTVIHSLRDVRVKIPSAVRKSDTVVLNCYYDMEGDSLYSVKWYKGKFLMFFLSFYFPDVDGIGWIRRCKFDLFGAVSEYWISSFMLNALSTISIKEIIDFFNYFSTNSRLNRLTHIYSFVVNKNTVHFKSEPSSLSFLYATNWSFEKLVNIGFSHLFPA